jgi:hypothetical protein
MLFQKKKNLIKQLNFFDPQQSIKKIELNHKHRQDKLHNRDVLNSRNYLKKMIDFILKLCFFKLKLCIFILKLCIF